MYEKLGQDFQDAKGQSWALKPWLCFFFGADWNVSIRDKNMALLAVSKLLYCIIASIRRCNNLRGTEHKYNTTWLKHQPFQKVMKWRRECKSQLLRGAFFFFDEVTYTEMSSLCNMFLSHYPGSINMTNCSKIAVTLTNELKTPENLSCLVYSYPNLGGPAGLGQSVSHTNTHHTGFAEKRLLMKATRQASGNIAFSSLIVLSLPRVSHDSTNKALGTGHATSTQPA